MGIDASDLLKEALNLPPEGRAALAASLIASLDEEIDQDAEALWATEIQRRLADLDAGRTETIPWDEVRASLIRR